MSPHCQLHDYSDDTGRDDFQKNNAFYLWGCFIVTKWSNFSSSQWLPSLVLLDVLPPVARPTHRRLSMAMAVPKLWAHP